MSKIRIRYGSVEVEYEGSEEFLKQELPQLLEAVARLHGAGPARTSSENDSSDSSAAAPPAGDTLTTNSIAAKVGGKSGPDLIKAACLRLKLAGIEKFPRKRILEEMQTASSYYKKTYSPNLSKYLSTLVSKGTLLETAKDTYAFPPAVEADLKGRLGG